MELSITNNEHVELKTTASLIIDPKNLVTLNEDDVYLFSHLSSGLLKVLGDSSRKNTVYLPQMLFKHLQKLVLSKFIEPLNFENIKSFPYEYPLSILGVNVTAFLSDDGTNGAISLLLEYDSKKIGYTGRFVTQGLHKKRIKKWKKHFQEARLDLLLLDSSVLKKADVFVSNTKKFKRFLTQTPADTLTSVKLSYLAPEQILDFQTIAESLGKKLLLAPQYQALTQDLFPFYDFYALTEKSLEQALADPEAYLLQADVVANKGTVYNKVEDLSLDQIPADQSLSELKEIVHVISPKEIFTYGDHELKDFTPLTTTRFE